MFLYINHRSVFICSSSNLNLTIQRFRSARLRAKEQQQGVATEDEQKLRAAKQAVLRARQRDAALDRLAAGEGIKKDTEAETAAPIHAYDK